MILPERVLGRSGHEHDVGRLGHRADRPGDVGDQVGAQLVGQRPPRGGGVVGRPGHGHDEHGHGLTGQGVGHPDRAGLGDERVLDEGGLDLDGRQPVPGHVDHLVDPALEPHVAVGVHDRAVARRGTARARRSGRSTCRGTARGRPTPSAPWRASARPTVMRPLVPGGTSSPCSSTTWTDCPGRATPAAPGTPVWTPGSVDTTAAPDSDCHHVSTRGARPPPTWRCIHTYASGLSASPTLPSSRTLHRSWRSGKPSGKRAMNERSSVGAV